jgi:hypothetical protein
MKTGSEPDSSSSALLREFFTAYDVRSLRISQSADIRDEEVSQVDIGFGQNAGQAAQNYAVTFKLLDQATDTHCYLLGIGAPPDFKLELTGPGRELGQDEMRGRIKAFIEAITPRVAKVHKEQSILGTQPLGKTFVLYNKTRFEVLADNGEGQLTIRIIRQDGSDEAILSANDLLDGLYSGAITQA